MKGLLNRATCEWNLNKGVPRTALVSTSDKQELYDMHNNTYLRLKRAHYLQRNYRPVDSSDTSLTEEFDDFVKDVLEEYKSISGKLTDDDKLKAIGMMSREMEIDSLDGEFSRWLSNELMAD